MEFLYYLGRKKLGYFGKNAAECGGYSRVGLVATLANVAKIHEAKSACAKGILGMFCQLASLVNMARLFVKTEYNI